MATKANSSLMSKVTVGVLSDKGKNVLDGPGEDAYGTQPKARMSHSMVDGAPKQRRRRGERSGDSKSSFVPTAASINVTATGNK